MGEMLPLNISCISDSISLVRRSEISDTLGFAYGITVICCVLLTVYPLESVAVTTTSNVPDFSRPLRLKAAPVVLDTVFPLQVAAYFTMAAPFFAVAVPGVTDK